jgi:membrane protein YdbS with pleckstrin-like domain
MKFIRRKNLYTGEDLLFIPVLHWMYIVKPLLLTLLVFSALAVPCYFIGFQWMGPIMSDVEIVSIIQTTIRYVFLAAIVCALLLFARQILLYAAAEYGITNKRLIMKKGLLRTTVEEIPTDKIESITCYQGLVGKIFHYGTIFITGIGGTKPVFYMVCRPYRIRRKIVEICEKNKAITIVHGAVPKPPVRQPAKAEPLYRYGTFVRVVNCRG